MNNRYKNPWFWVGFIGILLTATGQDLSTLTTWGAVWDMLISTFLNPVVLFGVALAGLGVFIDPTTPSITDGK